MPVVTAGHPGKDARRIMKRQMNGCEGNPRHDGQNGRTSIAVNVMTAMDFPEVILLCFQRIEYRREAWKGHGLSSPAPFASRLLFYV